MCTFQTNHLTIFTMGEDSFNCNTVTDVSTGECQALVDLYSSTHGENWTGNT